MIKNTDLIERSSFWFGRFETITDQINVEFTDRLIPQNKKSIPLEYFSSLSDDQKKIAYFQFGLLRPNLIDWEADFASLGSADDFLSWQFPCKTEEVAYLNHTHFLENPLLVGSDMHVYLGAPWATLIDKDVFPESIFKKLQLWISGYKGALLELGVNLHIHTVCQHIYWEKCIPAWKQIGVTDVWLSHMPEQPDPSLPFAFHPWALYAVNVEDSLRNAGIVIGKDPLDKKYLASFIGAHADHYISDVRLKLEAFSDSPSFYIKLMDKWHFEDVVYKHQVEGLPLEANYQIDDSVSEYNHVLSESRFALCPSGAGPNSLRLWEALAVGSVPVLLGRYPEMPAGGSLPLIDWDAIVVKVAEADLSRLPEILGAMPIEEVRLRQQRGMEAYALVREQRCF